MKKFVTAHNIRNNAIKLAHAIHQDGFIPDVIYVSLRGGVGLGNVISEYFKLLRKDQRPVFYAAVVARSYVDIHEHESVRIDGWTYNPQHLRHGDRVLIIDDIFDSGKTINYLVSVIESNGVPQKDIKIAVHDYKFRTFEKSKMKVFPDYYCQKMVINNPEEDAWVHYLSHELQGLTQEEIDMYYSDDQQVREILTGLTGKQRR